MTAERVERMARRLARDALRHGVQDADAEALVAAYRLAMPPRVARFDDHHPDLLHTARTALILLEDAGTRDRDVLCAAALAETRDLSLAPERGSIAAAVGASVARLLDAVPVPDEDDALLLEALVTAPPGATLVALAERLDHARHLHLRDSDEWEAYHAVTSSAYVPVATRVNKGLAQRLTWWCEMFASRFLGAS